MASKFPVVATTGLLLLVGSLVAPASAQSPQEVWRLGIAWKGRPLLRVSRAAADQHPSQPVAWQYRNAQPSGHAIHDRVSW